jgi:flagellar motor switch protein FliM
MSQTAESQGRTIHSQADAREIRNFDPENQHRVIRDRLHTLEIINERFAREFRRSILNYIRRNPDITVVSSKYMSFANFSHDVEFNAINMVSMKPLQGTSLVMFSQELVFFIVDSLFGGDGRFGISTDKKSFTATENRIIESLLNQVINKYEEAWESIYPIKMNSLRTETRVKFANITNSPNDVIIVTKFKLEIGNISTEFHIVIPYAMLEPIKDILTNPIMDGQAVDHAGFTKKMAGEIRDSGVEVSANFVSVNTTISKLTALANGDILPIDLPEMIQGMIDGVPVMECKYGNSNGKTALRVVNLIDHGAGHISVPAISYPDDDSQESIEQ